MRGKKHESHSTGRTVLFALAAFLLLSSCGGTAGSEARADELDRIGDDIAADIAADVQATAVAPTPEPTTPPTPIPDPTATPAPTPTPDPEVVLQQQAEAVALEYWRIADTIFDDPNNVDLTRAIQLEAPDTSQEDWALKLVAQRQEIESNGGDNKNVGIARSEVIEGATVRTTWSAGDRFTVDLCLMRGETPPASVMRVTVDDVDGTLLVSSLVPELDKSCRIRNFLLFADAEQIGLQYYTELLNVLADGRGVDLTRLQEIVDPNGFVYDYGETLRASLLENNHYSVRPDQPVEIIEGSVRFDVWRGDPVIAVDFCSPRTGIWRDFDTDEVTRETPSDPIFVTVRMTTTEPLLVSSFSEAGSLEETFGELPTCQLGDTE